MIKNKLREIRKLDYLISLKKLEIEKLDEYDKSNNDIIQQYTIEMNLAISDLLKKKLYIQSLIDQLSNPDMIDILYRRYFYHQKWETIAYEKHYTYQGLHKIHAKALIELENLISVDKS